jgi:death-on-curing protein
VPEPVFLTLAEVEYLHRQSINRFGGTQGVRDSGLIQAAIASVWNTWNYGSGDLFECAAGYAYHLAEAQAVLDGTNAQAQRAHWRFSERTVFRWSKMTVLCTRP